MSKITEVVEKGRKSIREMIGRVMVAGSNLWSSFRFTSSVDTTVADYFFWDRFRRGVLPGMRLSSLFAKPAAEIHADWIVGEGFSVALADDAKDDATEYTNGLLGRFVNYFHATFLTVVYDLKGLSDQYVVINPDGSVSVPSPDTVDPDYSGLDYRQMKKCTIRTKRDRYTVHDEYRLDGRTIRIVADKLDNPILQELRADGWQYDGDKTVFVEFDNLIGKIPVVHFANERSANETHGHPIYEPLLHLFDRYDSLATKGLDAAEIMANPIPVFKVDDQDDFEDENDEPMDQNYTDENGQSRKRRRLTFDRFATIIMGTDESFDFVSPQQGYTQDLKSMLKLLFLLILENLRIPEVVWGGELGESRASAVEQMKTFYMHITGQRKALEGSSGDDLLGFTAKGGLHELIEIWLRTRALLDRKVKVAPVSITWSALGEANDDMNFKWADAMYKEGLITGKTYVQMSGRVDNVDAELVAAKAEAQARQDLYDAALEEAMNNAAPPIFSNGGGQSEADKIPA